MPHKYPIVAICLLALLLVQCKGTRHAQITPNPLPVATAPDSSQIAIMPPPAIVAPPTEILKPPVESEVTYFKPTLPPTPKPTPPKPAPVKDIPFMTGAERIAYYLPMLENRRVALVVNQTSTANGMHLVDALISVGVELKKVFAPEHGFRGDADAGETVRDGKDQQTGLPIISLYGKHKKPSPDDLIDVDVVLFDIQDVGARFYTYISTLHYIMEACAENNKTCIVLDRPNPNGYYIDGPILKVANQSFVGMHPIPIVHGLTVAELAQMINGEMWLADKKTCSLQIVPCLGYTHQYKYELPIKPSPNLPNSRAVYLYPSLCLFEGTPISVGRGTDKQFQVIGAPALNKMPYQFKPVSKPGAKTPPHQNILCHGLDLSSIDLYELQRSRQINLKWLLDFYKAYPDKGKFFNSDLFFDKLAGGTQLRQQIISGASEATIRQSWQADLKKYKQMRKRYLLYPDFE